VGPADLSARRLSLSESGSAGAAANTSAPTRALARNEHAAEARFGELLVSADCEHHACFAVSAVLSPELDETTDIARAKPRAGARPGFWSSGFKTDRHSLLLGFDGEAGSSRWVVTASVSSPVMNAASEARTSVHVSCFVGRIEVSWGTASLLMRERVLVPAANELAARDARRLDSERRGPGSGNPTEHFSRVLSPRAGPFVVGV
jgi:hypothetical protein